MKLNLNDIEEIRGYLSLAKEFAPLADEVVDAIFAYGPALERILNAVTDWHVQNVTQMFNKYKENGFLREEALILTLNSKLVLKELISTIRNSDKK